MGMDAPSIMEAHVHQMRITTVLGGFPSVYITELLMIVLSDLSLTIPAVNFPLPFDAMTIFTDQRYSCIDLEYENYGFLTVDGIVDKTPHKIIYLVGKYVALYL